MPRFLFECRTCLDDDDVDGPSRAVTRLETFAVLCYGEHRQRGHDAEISVL